MHAYNEVNSVHSGLRIFVLPDTHYIPSSRLKPPIGVAVTVNILYELVSPPIYI